MGFYGYGCVLCALHKEAIGMLRVWAFGFGVRYFEAFGADLRNLFARHQAANQAFALFENGGGERGGDGGGDGRDVEREMIVSSKAFQISSFTPPRPSTSKMKCKPVVGNSGANLSADSFTGDELTSDII